jgi:predicted  nucleic acid-binding Zn-ribbon protein
VENRLRMLYELQRIDDGLNELDELRGNLPELVAELEGKVSDLESQVHEQEEYIKSSTLERMRMDAEIVSFREKIERYKSQQYQVRTNKEYDALTKEMETAKNQIAKHETEIETILDKQKKAKDELEKLMQQFEEERKELEEKKAELEEVAASTADGELKLMHEREKVVVRMNKADFAIYQRISKAKQGKAVVSIKKGTCGGCHNVVPPQKLLELRQHDRIYTCEFCGRILVSEELVQTRINL